jgi:hypothetical protein
MIRQAHHMNNFIKIFVGVLLAHLIVLNVVWVGFSAPLPRPPATFIYEGALGVQETGSGQEEVWQKGNAFGQFVFDHPEASYFNHWIEIRDPSKPVTNL